MLSDRRATRALANSVTSQLAVKFHAAKSRAVLVDHLAGVRAVVWHSWRRHFHKQQSTIPAAASAAAAAAAAAVAEGDSGFGATDGGCNNNAAQLPSLYVFCMLLSRFRKRFYLLLVVNIIGCSEMLRGRILDYDSIVVHVVGFWPGHSPLQYFDASIYVLNVVCVGYVCF